VRVDLIEICKSPEIEFAFLTVFLSLSTTQKSLSLSSKIILPAIFFHIHLIHSIVLLSSSCIAITNLSIHKDNICIATFHHTHDILINSENTFLSVCSINQKRV
jgi:hypothetical protein